MRKRQVFTEPCVTAQEASVHSVVYHCTAGTCSLGREWLRNWQVFTWSCIKIQEVNVHSFVYHRARGQAFIQQCITAQEVKFLFGHELLHKRSTVYLVMYHCTRCQVFIRSCVTASEFKCLFSLVSLHKRSSACLVMCHCTWGKCSLGRVSLHKLQVFTCSVSLHRRQGTCV